jgi:hypothetical protein
VGGVLDDLAHHSDEIVGYRQHVVARRDGIHEDREGLVGLPEGEHRGLDAA